jgi:prepilin-type N-terminal cleavage/methylation domain-containing protein
MARRAFTLVELLVVISIIGLLSTIATVSMSSARSKARDTKRQADVKQIITAMQMYYDTNGTYPNTGATGTAPLNCSGGGTNWFCLGHGSGTCWTSGYSGCAALDNALALYMAKIPDDPENNTAYDGDAYLYSYSNAVFFSPATSVIHWGYDQVSNSTNCLGGVYGQWGAGGHNRYYCALKLQP